jgi:SAM-dependent methyltransferase
MTAARLMPRACPICGEGAASRLFAESNIDLEALDGFAFASRKLPEYMHLRLVECGRCGLLYANPAFPPDTLRTAYEKADFDTSGEARWASITYGRHIRKLLPLLGGRSNALDVGTGDGVFIERLLEFGFDHVLGIEPSAAPRAAAKDHIKPLILPGLFEPGRFESSAFSLITCFQTLEHMFTPLETARTAFDLLKPGGAFVLVVHNRRAFSARLLGTKSPIFDIEHLQLFCRHTVRHLLASVGFRDVSAVPIWNSYPVHYWVKLFPLPPSIKCAALRYLRNSAAGNALVSLPAGNLIGIGFK